MDARPSPTIALPSTNEHRWPQTPTILSIMCIARGFVYHWSGPRYHSITIVTESLRNEHVASDIGFCGNTEAEVPQRNPASCVDYTTSQRVVDPDLL